ncbi:MAG: ribosome silencing factor [Clostridia bacterium]|nr:ribosome silencing factor [Clostridia bacterium]
MEDKKIGTENEEFRPDLELDENGIPVPESLARGIREILDRRSGMDISVIHVGEKIDMADYFVLCTAKSTTHVRALTDEVEYRLGLCGVKPDRSEGRGEGNSWMVVDYGNVLVHIFSRDARAFYNLDKLYSDAAKVIFEDKKNDAEDAE